MSLGFVVLENQTAGYKSLCPRSGPAIRRFVLYFLWVSRSQIKCCVCTLMPRCSACSSNTSPSVKHRNHNTATELICLLWGLQTVHFLSLIFSNPESIIFQSGLKERRAGTFWKTSEILFLFLPVFVQ